MKVTFLFFFHLSCGPGFQLEPLSGSCFKVLNVTSKFWPAELMLCSSFSNSKLVEFTNDIEVQGLVNLLKKGILILIYSVSLSLAI